MANSSAARIGTVISSTRRYIELQDKNGKIISAVADSKAMDIVTGDQVEFEASTSQPTVKRVLERKNCLIRCYRKIHKKLAANLDLVLIITAVRPLFNTTFIDRLIVAASEQEIDLALVLNKTDLGLEDTLEFLNIYQSLGMKIIQTSAKKDSGLDEIRSMLANPALKKVALVGISGVGKSSILNKLVPEADRKTDLVSRRTGQGKQVTTQSHAFTYQRKSGDNLYLIDLPGLSSFGLTHLDKDFVQNHFVEFDKFKSDCQFKNCYHLKEPNCSVKKAVEAGLISNSRYQSYCEIISDIEDAREY